MGSRSYYLTKLFESLDLPPTSNIFTRLIMKIEIDDLSAEDTIALLKQHLTSMASQSPPESVHALDLDELRSSDITFWSARDEGHRLMGCGALKQLTPVHAEIKSMRTADDFLRKGVAATLLEHVLKEARKRNYQRLSLETGSMESFLAARMLYERFGFTECEPFADYVEDPHSTFMTISL